MNRLVPLPCPFCGKDPEVIPVDPKQDGDAWGGVRCVYMRCQTYSLTKGHGVTVMDGASICDERGPQAYKRLAIKRWNRRAPLKSRTGARKRTLNDHG